MEWSLGVGLIPAISICLFRFGYKAAGILLDPDIEIMLKRALSRRGKNSSMPSVGKGQKTLEQK